MTRIPEASSRSVLRRVVPLALTLLLALAPVSAMAKSALSGISDAELARGFLSTVFGTEARGSGSGIVKKFRGPVRFEVVNASAKDRRKTVESFIRSLPKMIGGLDARLAGTNEAPNFKVVIVDRENYVTQARADAFGNAFAHVPGECMAKIEFSGGAIKRATAVIVSDEGEAQFRRCMVEEILQGLGPVNDDSSLAASCFNDRSRHARLMPLDRGIVAMLYDPRLAAGTTKAQAKAMLPDLIERARRAVR